MRQKHSGRLLLAATSTLLVAAATAADTAPISDAICISCHAEPSGRFHSQPTHKKFTCATCHRGGAEHVADTRSRPRLASDPVLCASCHEAKNKPGRRE